jgi:hypothetical protein
MTGEGGGLLELQPDLLFYSAVLIPEVYTARFIFMLWWQVKEVVCWSYKPDLLLYCAVPISELYIAGMF